MPTSTTRPSKGRGRPGWRGPSLRRWHAYLSVFVAPSLIFFALTGAVQTFRIPDQPGAPVLLQKLARVHKDDVFAVKPPRVRRSGAAEGARGPGPGPAGSPARPGPKSSTQAVKIFFSLASLLIAVTTGLGLWMALGSGRGRRAMWGLALAGTLIPILLVAL